MDDEGPGWEMQQDNERRRYEEEREARLKDERAWSKHWRETWKRWARNELNKQKSNAENSSG